MREILFRGKGIFTGKWHYGFFGKKLNVNTSEDEFFIIESTYTASTDSSYFTDTDVANETIGQYTGVKDRNGKKIFEGDIIEEDEGDGVVVYLEQFACYALEYKDVAGRLFNASLFDCRNIEIVGNIHDNPELLKK